jgi:predicted permease
MVGWWGWLARRLEVVLRKRGIERELDEEIRFHLEMEVREHIRSGASPQEARRRALVEFGGVERFKEEVREVRGGRLLDDLIQDTRVALRSLLGQPVFLVTAVLTLGIGIGGNVAMFAVLEATVFATLPYADSEQLFTVRSTVGDGARLGPYLSGPDFVDYRDQSRTVAAGGAIAPFPQRVTVTGAGQAERADAVEVSEGFFGTLGVEPVLGRGFLPEETRPGGSRVVVLGEGYWTRRFGRSPSVLGTTMTLNGIPHAVVGVMPAEARFMVDTDMWLPYILGQGMAGSRGAHNYMMIARLAPGVSQTTAQEELSAIGRRLEEAYPDTNDGWNVRVTPAREMLVESYRSTLELLMAAVMLLLVVACANVASLLMARGHGRASEMAVRSVMGARRGRLTRQLLTESGLLAAVAGVLGLAVAAWGQRGILAFMTFGRLGPVEAGFSATTIGAALVLSLGTVLLFGILPALRTAGTGAAAVLRGGTRISGSLGTARLRSALVVSQVVFTVVLVSVSGLLVRSLAELRSTDLGFRPESLLTAEIDLPAGAYGPEERIAFYEELRDRVQALGPVASVALASQIPISDPGNNWNVELAAGPGSEPVSALAHQRTVFPGYFDAMGIPVLAGRDVEASDRDAEPASLVLSAATALALLGDQDPLGRIVSIPDNSETGASLHQVVGVVGNATLDSPLSPQPPAMYYAYHERTPTRMRLAVRYAGDGGTVAGQIRSIVQGMNANLPLDRVELLQAAIDRQTRAPRSLAMLIAVFAVVAVILSSVGLYGVIAFQVTRRLGEIGIRMALGASVATVSGSILRDGVRLVGLGLVIGVPLSLFAGRFVQGFLFGIGSADPVTYVGVTLLLGAVATVACLLPARRAASVDPVQSLRSE